MEQSKSVYRFEKGDAGTNALLRWFDWLHDIDGHTKGGRGDRAHLRRAKTPDEILFSDAFHRLMREPNLPDALKTESNWIAMAMVAGALAHCRPAKEGGSLSTDSFATQLGKPKEPGAKAPMSELRFAQLQKSRDYDAFYRRVLRAIQLIGGNINILSLSNSILLWQREHQFGVDRVPTKRLAVSWARDYFAALPASENH